LYDMMGNVWEWCGESEESGVLRGGSWVNFADVMRVAQRNNINPARTCDVSFGFRCVSGFPAAQQ